MDFSVSQGSLHIIWDPGTPNPYDINIQAINNIFGRATTVNVANLNYMRFGMTGLLTLQGVQVKIEAGDKDYIICPSNYSQSTCHLEMKTAGTITVNPTEINTDGAFFGTVDEIGQKLINLFFSNYNDGASICLNGKIRKLVKDGNSINFD